MFWEAFLVIQLLSPTGAIEHYALESFSTITACKKAIPKYKDATPFKLSCEEYNTEKFKI